MKKLLFYLTIFFTTFIQAQTTLSLQRINDIWSTGQVPKGVNNTNTWYTLYNRITDTTSLSNRIDLKEDVANKSTDGTFAANSDTLYPSQKAVRTYIAQNAAASLTFMLVNAASSWGGSYKQALSLPLYTVGAVATQTVTATTSGDLIGTFSTNSGYPNTTVIPIGVFSAHFDSQKGAGSNNYYMYYEIYKKVLAGTETLLTTSDNTTQTSVNTVVQQDATAAITTSVTLLATDRIVIKIYAKMVSSTAVITLRYDDATNSRFQMPALIGSLDDYAKIASPTFTGTVTIPTPFTLGATSVNTTGTQLNYLASATGTTGTTSTNLVFSASPALTGSPTAPTQSSGDSTTNIATTAFVDAAVSALTSGSSYWTTVPGTPTRSTNRIFTITDASNTNLRDKLLGRTTVFKWTDGGNTKMAMVVSATYSSNTVTITTVGDTISSGATMSSFKYALNKCRPIVFAIAGTIATGTDLTGRYYCPAELKVFGADAYHTTAGTTNSTDYDINKNGTTIFTTKVSIASGATTGTGFSANSGTTTATSDYFSVDCDAVSTTAPVDLYLELFAVPLNDQYLN